MLFLIVFLILLALVLILLCLPLEIELLAQFREHSSLRLRFRNFFCRISWEAGKERKRGREAEKKPGVDHLGRLEKAFDVIQISGLWERLWLLLKRLFRVVKVISIDTDLRVSLGDDYYTGMLCGLLLPVVLILNQQDNNDIKLQPAFEEDLILQRVFENPCAGASRGSHPTLYCLYFFTSGLECRTEINWKTMEKEILIVETALVADQVNITALVRISLKHRGIKGSPSFYVTKQPAFLIVEARGQVKIYSISGEEVTADRIKREFPDVTLDQKVSSVLRRWQEQ